MSSKSQSKARMVQRHKSRGSRGAPWRVQGGTLPAGGVLLVNGASYAESCRGEDTPSPCRPRWGE